MKRLGFLLALFLLTSPAFAHWPSGPAYTQASWKWFTWDECLTYAFNYYDHYQSGFPGISLHFNPSYLTSYGCGSEEPACGHCCHTSHQGGLGPRGFYNVIDGLVVSVYATITPTNSSPICSDCTILAMEVPNMGVYYYPFPDFSSHGHSLPAFNTSAWYDWRDATRRSQEIAVPFPNITLEQVEASTFSIYVADPTGEEEYTGISSADAIDTYGFCPYRVGVLYAHHTCGQQGIESSTPPASLVYPIRSEGSVPTITNVRKSSWGRIKTLYR